MKRWLTLYAALAYVFLYAPLVILAVFSFNASRYTQWTGWSLGWYRAMLADAQLREGAWNSLLIAAISAVFSTAIGAACAYGLWKRRSRWLSASLYLSLVTPEIVTGVSLLAFYEWIFHYARLRLGMYTVVLAHIAFSIAYVVIVVIARLRTADPAIEEAALDLGATEWQTFWRVTLPYMMPAILAAALLAFTLSIDDYVITSLVAGVDSQTLPMVIYAMARRGVSPEVNAVSTMIVFGLGVIILFSERLRRA